MLSSGPGPVNKSVSMLMALAVLIVVGLTMGEDGSVANMSRPAAERANERPAAPATTPSSGAHHVNPWALDGARPSRALAAAPIAVLPAADRANRHVTLPPETVDPKVAGASEIR